MLRCRRIIVQIVCRGNRNLEYILGLFGSMELDVFIWTPEGVWIMTWAGPWVNANTGA